MATANQTNVHAALAIQLSNPRVPSEEEKIFQEALSSVQDEKRKHGKLPAIFDNIRHAQNIEDVRFILELERQANRFWSKDVGRSWLQHLGVFAEYLWYYKVVLDAVVTRSASLGAPIWGTMAFILNFLKDLTATAQDLKSVEESLKQSMERFKRYFKDGRLMSPDLRSALTRYYKTVITFVIDMHGEFIRGRTTTIFWALHRSVKLKLSDLSKTIVGIVYDVDQGALHDRHDYQDQKLEKLNIQLQYVNTPPSTSAAVVTNGTSTRNIIHNLPQPSHAFTGRRQYLDTIWRSLHGTKHCQRRVALYGMGGIGKSQILQKYATDHVKAIARPQPYATTLYINAHSASSVFSAVSSFMRLYAVKDPLLNDVSENDYSAFHTWLLQRQDWLLVFDNVQEYSHIHKAVPYGGSGHVLCSTRHKTVAQQFTNGYASQPLEIKEMDVADSTSLVLSLVSTSSYEADKDLEVANQVASFAKGIPLVIEQIIHNALLGEMSVQTTLRMVTEKTELLRQRNISSLHPENLALGGVVMQAFETLQRVSDKAEALFTILAYMEPSSIPLSMLREGSKQFQDYLGRQHTYDRGAIALTPGGSRARQDKTAASSCPNTFWEGADPFRPKTWSQAGRSNLARRAQAQAALPLDDTEVTDSLRQKCNPTTPLGRLFENQVMIDDAITVLCDAAVIRKIGADTLWMHDLVSEVAKALIADSSSASNQTMALAAATTVYLAFPIPENRRLRDEWTICGQFLPHAISCHSTLREIGILNNCSIGPELSHLIASTLGTPRSSDPVENYYLFSAERYSEHTIRVVDYYVQAYVGYMAGWQRLKDNHGIDEKRILLSTYADREREKAWSYQIGKCYSGYARYGRSAPWRAIQTAVRLLGIFEIENSVMSEECPLTLEKALMYTKQAIDFYKLAFGSIDTDTLFLNECLYHLFGPRGGRWQEAYEVGIHSIKELTGYNGSVSTVDLNRLQRGKCKITGRPLSESEYGCRFGTQIARSCIELSKVCTDANDNTSSRALAKEAIGWWMIHLRYIQWRHGPEYHTAWESMTALADAYERMGNGREAMSWYAGAVVRAMHPEWGSYGQWGCPDDYIEEAIVAFEGGVVRLEGTWNAGDNELRELIHDVQAKAQNWREERNIRVAQEAAKFEVIEPVDWEEVLKLPEESSNDDSCATQSAVQEGDGSDPNSDRN